VKADDIILARLQAVAGVTAIVGAPPNDRIYKAMAPENPAYPLIVHKQISSRRMQGTYDDPGFAFATVQVISFDATADGADALDEQVRLALERYGSSQPAGVQIAGTMLQDITLGSSVSGYSFEVEKEYVSTDYTVMFQETAP